MQISIKPFLAFIGILTMFVYNTPIPPPVYADSEKKTPNPQAITFDLNVKEYTRLLGGPPETVTMHSGLVVLEPGESVGTHNTKNYEEVLIVLEGEGKMVITNGSNLILKSNTIAYCPPRTEHNVWNTGKKNLRYIYIVANAE